MPLTPLFSCCCDGPFGSTIEVEAVRKDQFAEFAKAVQVGLLDFQGPQGIQAFFSLMRSRYGEVLRVVYIVYIVYIVYVVFVMFVVRDRPDCICIDRSPSVWCGV